MAEAFLRDLAGDRFEAESAGLEPTTVHPLVVEAMQEIGVDLSGKATKSVFKLYQEGRLYDYVITVCREAIEEKCPVFPGLTRRLAWPFDNPEDFRGSHDERLDQVRRLREEIRTKVQEWTSSFEKP
jgi:arsenate reductase